MFGKVLGFAALGVAAVAAAPFTGGGSILAATTAAGSLAGAGTVAAAVGAGAVGAGVGKKMADEEARKERQSKRALAEQAKKTEKFEKIATDHKMHTDTIIAFSALGIAMANADGEISPEEQTELYEFVLGLSALNLPQYIVDTIESMIANPPTFNEAMNHLEKIETKDELDGVRDILIAIMRADGIETIEERSFLTAFDNRVKYLSI